MRNASSLICFAVRHPRALLSLMIVVGLVSFGPSPGRAVEVTLVPFANGLVLPTDIAHAGDGRLFIVEQLGRIQILDADGSVFPLPFLDIGEGVSCCGEQGLLGLAFHPNYASNGFFYVNYTDVDGTTHISRFTVSENPDVADTDSEVTLLTVDQPFANHNGGKLSFGPDGFLYISLGDGGAAGDPFDAAQNRQNLLGKLLRIDVDSGSPYAIPATNPFVDDPEARGEVWALGLRNPWRFSFDRLTGDLYIGDVGQNTREEVNFQPASSAGGENYGWRCYEGNAEFNSEGCAAAESFVFPVHDYLHDLGCSVIGGVVYRGSDFPDLDGHYLFGDFCSGRLWSVRRLPDSSFEFNSFGQFPVGFSVFGEDSAGEVYAADYFGSRILRVRTGCQAPGKSILLWKAPADPSKSKLIWKWLKGPATVQADFGDPAGGATAYDLIVSNDELFPLLSIQIPPDAGWKPLSSKGYKFSDKAASNGGIFKALLKGGSAGKSKILIKGKGPEVPSPPVPFGDLTALTVQLFKSDGTTCWQADFPAGSIKASDTSLKAKSP